MDGDYKVWAVIGLLFGLWGASYYGVYQLGKKATYRAIVPQLIEMTKETYGEGYGDGLKQGQIDCMAKGVKRGRH